MFGTLCWDLHVGGCTTCRIPSTAPADAGVALNRVGRDAHHLINQSAGFRAPDDDARYHVVFACETGEADGADETGEAGIVITSWHVSSRSMALSLARRRALPVAAHHVPIGAVVALSTVTRSCGLTPTLRPRLPPDTRISSNCRALSSSTVLCRVRWPSGEMPPTT